MSTDGVGIKVINSYYRPSIKQRKFAEEQGEPLDLGAGIELTSTTNYS